jgi:hypothetical protein
MLREMDTEQLAALVQRRQHIRPVDAAEGS